MQAFIYQSATLFFTKHSISYLISKSKQEKDNIEQKF